MGVSLARKRATKQTSTPAMASAAAGLTNLLLRRPLPIPPLLLLLMLLVCWCTSTFFSVSFFHVCISSRKLNLYCLSAGTRPDFHQLHAHNIIGGNSDRHNVDNVHDQTNMNRTHIGEDEQGHDQRDEAQEEKESATHALKELVMSLRATSKPANRNGSIRTCEGRGVFVYELPAKFNKELLHQCEDLVENMCQFFDNNGTGSSIPELGLRWFNTHLYSLEPIFHSRALKHRCRIHKPEDAKLFFVPFYGGIDILRCHFKNVSNEVKDRLGFELLDWLEAQDSWRRNAGKDHVFVLGNISWDFRRPTNRSWASNLLERDQMQNPIKLLIERKPWHHDIGVPHPTFFLPNSDTDIAEHQSKLAASDRGHLVAFTRFDRPGSPASIRSALIQQCKSSNRHCRFLDCHSTDCPRRPAPIIELFSTSEFCLQPPGDSPMRKWVFNSWVSGCIPVLFDPFTAYYQYPWR